MFWTARNRICFEKKLINNPNKILFSVCTVMKYWAALHSGEAQKTVQAGVEIIIKTAATVMCSQSAKQVPRLTAGVMSWRTKRCWAMQRRGLVAKIRCC
jgi:hypothetical protein